MKTLSFWKKSFYSALVFFGTVIVLSMGYSAWNTTMSTVSSGSGLTANGWNALVNNIDDLHSRLSNITFTGGKVGIGTTNPQAKLEVNGDFIRTIARAQGFNQIDATDSGALATRTLTFVKKHADTGIRVTYSDNRRVTGNGSGRWEAKFNGVSCANPGSLAWDLYEGAVWQDHHRTDTTIGTCFGLASGTYTIQIYVGPVSGNSVFDLYTGWLGVWSLEAEEVR